MSCVSAFLISVIACLFNPSYQVPCPDNQNPDRLFAGNGVLTSTGYPLCHDFGSSADCNWLINSSTVVRLAVEDTCMSPGDELVLYDASTGGSILAQYVNCSTTVQYVWSIGQELDVQFVSLPGAAGIAQFKLSYSADSSTCPDATPRCLIRPSDSQLICVCCKGFESVNGNGPPCTDVDECQSNNGGCSTNAVCTNTVGSRTCKCNSGFSGSGVTCSTSGDASGRLNCWKVVKHIIRYEGGKRVYRQCFIKLCKYNKMFRKNHPRKCGRIDRNLDIY